MATRATGVKSDLEILDTRLENLEEQMYWAYGTPRWRALHAERESVAEARHNLLMNSDLR